MTNLVRLHLDKDTGKIVAGGSIPSGGVPGEANLGFLHTQDVPSTLWVISHNIGSKLLLVQVFDSSGTFIIPDSMTIVDINTVEVRFQTAITGRAHIIFFTI